MSDDHASAQNSAGAGNVTEVAGGAVVSDHARLPRAEDQPRVVDNDPDLRQFLSFARTLLVPMLVWKVCMLYFGLNYSQYPGEGYGYGLVATMAASLTGFGVFLWKNRRAD